MKSSSSGNTLFLIIISFAAVYIIWGSTYMFVAITVEDIPPYLMSSIRFSSAALLLASLTILLNRYHSVSAKQLKNAIFAGFLLIGCGTGGVAWALQFVDSGFTALVISGQPLLIVLMMWAIDRKRPATQSFGGIFLSMLGMYLLVSQNELIEHSDQWKGIAAILFCMVAWGFGSIFVTKVDLPKPQMINNACQMLSSGFFLLLFSFILESPRNFEFSSISTNGWLALSFLIVFGAVIAFSAFNYLLTKVSPEKVATSTYVNPIIALILGWWIRDELVTVQSIIAAGIMLLGVFFINSTPEQSKNFIRRLKLVGRRRV